MGNTRHWTTQFNARTSELETFVRSRAGRSKLKRIEAVNRAASMPNSLPPVRRSVMQEGK
jgi:hypothetical protein